MTHELAWAAGFFDGEGTFGAAKQTGVKKKLRLAAQVAQCDRRVLDRFRDAVNLGKVFGPYKTNGGRHTPHFQWHANTPEQAQAVIAMLWKWLSPVKRKQAQDAITDWRHSFG